MSCLGQVVDDARRADAESLQSVSTTFDTSARRLATGVLCIASSIAGLSVCGCRPSSPYNDAESDLIAFVSPPARMVATIALLLAPAVPLSRASSLGSSRQPSMPYTSTPRLGSI